MSFECLVTKNLKLNTQNLELKTTPWQAVYQNTSGYYAEIYLHL